MKESGVFGGSKFGATFFHASANVESMVCAAGRPVEKIRARMVRAKIPVVARRNMVAVLEGSLGYCKVGVEGWCFGGVAVEMRDGVMGGKLRARGVFGPVWFC